MQAALDAVAHPGRREILRLVWDEERSSREIAEHFDTTWQAVSHNLKVLRTAGLVAERRDGRQRLYRADRKNLKPIETLLTNFWRQDLERLGKVIERDRGRRNRARS
jgi:DNA-binding transcriptional ArsR family regulator